MRVGVCVSESVCAAQSSLITRKVEEWEDAEGTRGAF